MKKSFKLRPINKWPKNKKVFDIISFVIFCPKHNEIAVTPHNSEQGFEVGYPFVYLSSYMKIGVMIEDSLLVILSGGDSELMTKYKTSSSFRYKCVTCAEPSFTTIQVWFH